MSRCMFLRIGAHCFCIGCLLRAPAWAANITQIRVYPGTGLMKSGIV